MKRVLLTTALAGVVALVAAPALADHDPDNEDPAQEACGGEYPASVEVETIMITDALGVGYCSDGTFGDLGVPPSEDGHSQCGGENPVTVEIETIQLPGHGISYCSDGTIEGVEELLPESPISEPPSAGSCGGGYVASVEAGTLEDPTNINSYSYCSDGTLQDLGVPENGDGQSGCGGNHPVTVETDTINVNDSHGVSYCSDGTIDEITGLLP